jgi:tetratricopeptide (TPR) repeat protein
METNRKLPFPSLALLGALILLCLAPRKAAAQGQTGNIIGEVRVARLGFPPKALLVNLQSRGGTINSAYTDGQGRFGFYALPGGFYDIVIQDSDYAPSSVRVALDPDVMQSSFVQITLSLRAEAKPDAGAGRVSGSNPNVIDLNEYTRKFPKKAVKEYEKGVRANADRDVDSAIRHFQKSLELAPEFYPAHNELGRAYMAKPDLPAAQQQFEEAVRLNQSDAEGLLNLANVLLLTRRYDEALRNVQAGLQREPNSAFGMFVLGSIYERTGKLPEADRALHQALELDPKMAKVHLELVNLYLTQHNKPEAATELKAFLKKFPDDPFAPKAREVLKKLEK